MLYGEVLRRAPIDEEANEEGITSRGLLYELISSASFYYDRIRPQAPQITLNVYTYKRALEGVCTSCTNQAHYSLVRIYYVCALNVQGPTHRHIGDQDLELLLLHIMS